MFLARLRCQDAIKRQHRWAATHCHRKRTPRAFYDYVNAGRYTEGTYRANSGVRTIREIERGLVLNPD